MEGTGAGAGFVLVD